MPQCSTCKRPVKGHDGPCGQNCNMSPLDPKDALVEDVTGTELDKGESVVLETSVAELEKQVEAEEKKQQLLREQIKVRDLQVRMAQAKLTTQSLTDQLHHLSNETVVSGTGSSKNKDKDVIESPNLNTLRQCPETAASASALLNAYFPNVDSSVAQGVATSSQNIPGISSVTGVPGTVGGNHALSRLDRQAKSGHPLMVQPSSVVEDSGLVHPGMQPWLQQPMIGGSMQPHGVPARVKSGADIIFRESFKKQIAWPHLYYESVECKDKLSFSDLSCDMLAAGEVEIVQALLDNNAFSHEEGRSEIMGRLSRLKETMYLANVQGFDRAKRYFELTGKRVEAGGSWNCDNNDIYVRSAIPAALSCKTDASNIQKANDDKYSGICMSWNYNTECSFVVKNGKCAKAHICNKCIRRGETFTHKAKECTFSQGSADENPR